jgi:hypothetical protein
VQDQQLHATKRGQSRKERQRITEGKAAVTKGANTASACSCS